jgi:hypothetical protein
MPYLTTNFKNKEPIVLVNEDLYAIQGLSDLALTGYSGSGIGNDIPKGFGGDLDKVGYVSIYEAPKPVEGLPDENGYIWTLPNGQAFPPTRTLLFSNHKRTYYYEDKDLKTKFQVIGMTLEQCSRVLNEAVGTFTGNRQFNTVDAFGKGYSLLSLEVKTTFPFDRLGNLVLTEYTLWVHTYVKYFEDNVVSITTNSDGSLTYHYANGSTAVVSQNGAPISGPGYTTGDGDASEKPATQNRNALLIIGGLGLILLSSKSK